MRSVHEMMTMSLCYAAATSLILHLQSVLLLIVATNMTLSNPANVMLQEFGEVIHSRTVGFHTIPRVVLNG